jgi:hypothetical protein
MTEPTKTKPHISAQYQATGLAGKNFAEDLVAHSGRRADKVLWARSLN